MAKETKINYTENDRAIVDVLKNAGRPMTIAEMNEASGKTFVSGHIVSAMKKQLITVAGEVEVERPSTRKVYTYNFVTADVLSREDGKPYSYTDGEQAILTAASSFNEPFTLEQLASAMGIEVVRAGSTNGLIRKGNLSKGDQIAVPSVSKSVVKTYAFANDIPNA